MAYYTFLDENNIVTNVITGNNPEGSETDWEAYYSAEVGQPCKRTSYNGTIRANFAGVGYKYDEVNDVFIAPQPYPSWVLDKTVWRWIPPIPYPTDGNGYVWDEEIVNWVILS